MQLPSLNFETAFAMTALFSGSMVGLLWVVGRNYPRQGTGWIMASVGCLGIGYLLISFSNAWPSRPTLLSSYWALGFGTSLSILGIRRFLQRRWSLLDTAVLLMPASLALIWQGLAGNDYPLRDRLTNMGFMVQITVLCAVLWNGRKVMVGNGWKVMLFGAVLQWLSIAPLTLPGAPPSTINHVAQTAAELVISWGLCIMMFVNLQMGPLSFLMMLHDRRNAEEREAAEIDLLTQVPNRRSLERRLGKILPTLYQQHEDLGVVLLDIDHFKQVNDNYGHEAGDRVLQHVAHVLRQQLRQNELLARYGGEEFVIFLPYADQAMAASVAARVVQAIAGAHMTREGLPPFVTVSAGVYAQKLTPQSMRRAGEPPHWRELLMRADEALYEAKRSGRNRYVVASVGSAAAMA